MADNVIRVNFNKAPMYQLFTGKPEHSRPALEPERNTLIAYHSKTIGDFEGSEIASTDFDCAYSAVLDLHEAYLDAACDLCDSEIDELCTRILVPRWGFDRRVRIAKIQKQAPSEIERGLENGKKWASDRTLLQE